MTGPLEQIRVLDLTRLLPGPFCTQILGDLGAEVIKIEDPVGGDYIRGYPPRRQVDGALYLSINRNKKSLTLDLRLAEGREIFLKMLLKADVLIEQFRPGVMERLGLGYEKLKAVNPGLIMCSISGYGQTGPYKDLAGHDINYLSTAGILDLIGSYEGAPVLPGIQIADIGGGSLWAAFSIMAALFAREKTRRGQYIDVAMMDSVFTYTCMLAGAYFMDHKIPRRGEELLNGGYAWYNVYRTRDDRYVALGMLEVKFWEKFCQAIEREDWIKKQFAPSPVQREIIDQLAVVFASRTSEEWTRLLEPLDICFSRVNSLDEAVNDPHLRERGMVVEIDHPVEGRIFTLGFPVKFSDLNCEVRLSPPALGQHTEELLQDLGYSAEEIGVLKNKQVI
ncbi:MAG: CaiB/BaiF CoA-transferase family protein [Syntrophomonadaceae bacterium]